MPRVSICIPAYKPDHFEIALRSAIEQTYSDTEIFISDDCPTDAIKEICNRYAPKLRYERNSRPGVLHNIIRSIEASNGDYIKFLFDDDIMSPDCVEKLLYALVTTKNRNTKIALSPRGYINQSGKPSGSENFFNVKQNIKIINGDEYIRLSTIHHRNFIGEFSTVMFRKTDVVDENGYFNIFSVDDIVVPDIATWFHLSCKGALAVHPETLSYFRRHGNSLSTPSQNSNFIHCITYYEKIQRDALRLGYLTQRDIVESRANLAKVYRYWARSFPQLSETAHQLEKNRPFPTEQWAPSSQLSNPY